MGAARETKPVIPAYLDMLDSQRETAFAALDGLSDEQVWQRPGKNEWCIGELLDHNYLLFASTLPYVRLAWRLFSWLGKRFSNRLYENNIPDLYRDGKFPMWVGFLWTPRYNPQKRIPVEDLKSELRELHGKVRSFYEGKDEDVLGNLAVFDPYFGWLNLITTLRLGCYHDQLHYEDVIKLANSFKDW